MSNKQFKMKYSIGTNFDDSFIEFINTNDKDKQIKSVFGKIRSDLLGGGRPSQMLPNLSMKNLKAFINLCHSNGLQFNYLLNPQCTDNRECNPSTHKKMIKNLNKLCNIGIDSITVNSPYLCELIKKQFPHLKVTIGLYAMIYSIQHVKQWIELGADEITLHHRLNRNFPVLEKILKYTKNKSTEMRLIANNICLHDCPYQINHGNAISHASQKNHHSHNCFFDYNIFKCNYNKIKDSAKLISSDWIRPEDVKYYEQLCESVGNHNFSIKLVERTKPTAFLEKVVTAYLSEKYNGNLIDLLNWTSMQGVKDLHIIDMSVKAIIKRFNIKEINNFSTTLQLPNVYIDNNKLDGFLGKFIKNYSCDSSICADNSLEKTDNKLSCSYCASWANKVVSYDKKELDNWFQKVNEVSDSLNTSKFYK